MDDELKNVVSSDTVETEAITEVEAGGTSAEVAEMAETMQETGPMAPTISSGLAQPQAEKPKSKRTLMVALVCVLVALIGVGGLICFSLLAAKNNGDGQTSVAPKIEEEPVDYEKLKITGDGVSDFDLAFLKNSSNENIVYSPLSIKYALAMLADAAEGETKTQILNILGDFRPKAYLNSSNRSLANAMFVRSGSLFADYVKPSYINDIETKYNASLIYDTFETPDNANAWVSEKTLGIINDMFDESNFNEENDFALLNALAIDMNWNNQLQCTSERQIPCMSYFVSYAHEDYDTRIMANDFGDMLFNYTKTVPVAKVGTSVNRYDIIGTLGEEYIRETVQKKYEEWILEYPDYVDDADFSMDKYMEELASNYGRINNSTDFSFYVSDNERVFAKDLMEYDGATLQYVGIMPLNDSLNDYISSLSAETVTSLISNLKDAANIENYTNGVVTKLYANIPFFKFSYTNDELKDDLMKLGIEDAFSPSDADLSNMAVSPDSQEKAFIKEAVHKADIDFSNDGIKAAAVTAMVGGLGSAGYFDYRWEVPVEEIDLTFNRPFVFLIRDKASSEVWFVGSVYMPA